MRSLLFILAALLLPLPALADTISLCGIPEQTSADGRLLGHLPYAETPRDQLAPAPTGFAVGQPCLVQRDVVPALAGMLVAAQADPQVAGKLRGLSCFRSIARQTTIFCSRVGHGKRSLDPAERADSSAPPGYSEHATGYAIDFTVRPSGHCADADPCIAATPAGQWLLAHAREFGFELSFPQGNVQGVTWEPWHWRWVGAHDDAPGADMARARFAVARGAFPASPMIAIEVRVAEPAPFVALPPPAATEPAPAARPPRKRKRRGLF